MTDDGRFTRIEQLLGSEGLAKLQNSFVLVIGLGAVGSYAVEGLARAAVGRLRLVDFDIVKFSNINRQLYALESTLDRKKVEVARSRVLDINPSCRVEIMDSFVHEETIDDVLDGQPDVVIDAIDSLNPKAHLLTAVQRRGLCVVSAMGAALRSDPSLVRVGKLRDVHNCKLASKLRKLLRRRDVSLDFDCVYSVEPTSNARPGAVGDYDTDDKVLARGRSRRTMGSLPTLTGIFGLTAANHAIRIISEH